MIIHKQDYKRCKKDFHFCKFFRRFVKTRAVVSICYYLPLINAHLQEFGVWGVTRYLCVVLYVGERDCKTKRTHSSELSVVILFNRIKKFFMRVRYRLTMTTLLKHRT